MTKQEIIAAATLQYSALNSGDPANASLWNLIKETAELLTEGGGGTVLPAGEIAVGTGTGIGSSPDLFYDAGGDFNVKFGGLTALSSGVNWFSAGDLDNDDNGMRIELDGGSNQIALFNNAFDAKVGINVAVPEASLDVLGTLKFVTGNQGANKILTSDVDGNADWSDPSGIQTVTGTLVDNTDPLNPVIDNPFEDIPAYDDDTAAGVGELTEGMLYQTTGSGAAPLNVAGILMVKQ